MLKQLRIRFVTAAMTGMLLITIIVVGTINGINYYNTLEAVHGMLDLIAYNGGSFNMPKPDREKPEEPGTGESIPQKDIRFPEGKDVPYRDRLGINEETPFITRFFVAKYDESKNIIEINMDNIASFTRLEAERIAEDLREEEFGYGRAGSYYYLYQKTDGGNVLIYLDCKRDVDKFVQFLVVSLGVAAVSLIMELIILILLSKRVVKPVVDSITKQKEFITDASHELKTPLTIISANTEVLELTEGENEWTASIKNQTGRMTKLVNDMVFLARMDEDGGNFEINRINLSELIGEAAAPFLVVARSKGIGFSCELEEGCYFEGNESCLRQLVSILFDNGIKYVDHKGIIVIKFYRQGKRAYLKIFNSCNCLKEEQLSLLFDRFYRVDKSRSRQTGGSGIGLSIARAIVDMHDNMSITVRNSVGEYALEGTDAFAEGIEFTVSFK